MLLAELFGSRTAEKVFLYLYHYNEAHARVIAKDMQMSYGQVERQLKKYESIGLLISKEVGRSRVYSFNRKYLLIEPVLQMIAKVYNSIPVNVRKELFKSRHKARRSDKPVIR